MMSALRGVVAARGVVLTLAAGTLLAAGGMQGCTKNAATGKNIFTLGMSMSDQVALGGEAAPQFTQEYGGKVDHAGLQTYVSDIGKKMAAQTEADNPSLPWEFTLLNTQVINAFALPGGKVFFTRGLAEKLTTEAQMAGVIGHEIGHVTAEHGAQRIASTTAFNVGIGITAIGLGMSGNEDLKMAGAIGVPALAIGGNLLLLKYGRDEELEADRLGVRYMAKVGYNPRGQREVMEVLASLSKGSSQPAFLSTHPNPGDRVKQVDDLLKSEYASTQNNPNYQDFPERYKTQFLDVIKKIPTPPPPKETGLMPLHKLPDGRVVAVNLDDPATWCSTCIAMAIPTASTEQPDSTRAMMRRASATPVDSKR